MDCHLIKVNHIHHCMKYKKTVFRCIFPVLSIPQELEKYLFTFIGVFPLHFDALSYTVNVPGLLPSSTWLPLHMSSSALSQNKENDLVAFEL